MPLQVKQGVRIWPPPLAGPIPESAPADALDIAETVATENVFGANTHPGRKLPVPFVEQTPMRLWCWVACTKMIVNSFGITASRTDIAERHLRHLGFDLDCFPPIAGGACDRDTQPGNVAFIFSDWGLSVDAINFERRVSFDDVVSEISHERPVLAGVYWIINGARNGGHVVVIRGWSIVDGEPLLYVNDPLEERTAEVPYDDLAKEYGEDNDGKWQLSWTGFRRQQ